MGRLNSERDLFNHRLLITHTRFRTKKNCGKKLHDTLRHMKNASTKHTSKVPWILSGGKVNYSGSETSLTVVSAHDFPPLNDKINTL